MLACLRDHNRTNTDGLDQTRPGFRLATEQTWSMFIQTFFRSCYRFLHTLEEWGKRVEVFQKTLEKTRVTFCPVVVGDL